MEVCFLTVRCFLHPFSLFQAVELAAPTPTPIRTSPEIPSVERSPLPELKARPHSTEPIKTPGIRASPVLSQQEYHKQLTMFTDKLKRSFKSSETARNAAGLIEKETKNGTTKVQEVEWGKFCVEFKTFVSNNANSISIGKQIVGDVFDMGEVNGEDLYVKVLHYKMGRLFEVHARTLQNFGLFAKFPPFVMYTVQREYKQQHILPTTIDGYMSYAKAVELNLLPSNIETYIDLNSESGDKWKLCCIGLFHSFIYRVNFVSAYWKCTTREEWKHSLVNFNRHNSTASIL